MATSSTPRALQPWEKLQAVPHLEELHATDADWEDFGGLKRLDPSYVPGCMLSCLVGPGGGGCIGAGGGGVCRDVCVCMCVLCEGMRGPPGVTGQRK